MYNRQALPTTTLNINKKIAAAIAGALSLLMLGAMTVGSASAYSYSSSNQYSSQYNNQYNNQYTNYQQRHRYVMYRWVYDPCLHRTVLIAYNVYYHRWELVYSHDRYERHNDDYQYRNNRDYFLRSMSTYWYNRYTNYDD